jgi:hypothetical protein
MELGYYYLRVLFRNEQTIPVFPTPGHPPPKSHLTEITVWELRLNFAYRTTPIARVMTPSREEGLIK